MEEFEKKILLSGKEYDILMTHFEKSGSTTRQVNYYFDTDDFLMNKRGVTCRIREKNGKLKATYKDHRQAKCFCSEEISCGIRNGLEDNDFTNMGLTYQGCLDTYRTLILKNSFCTITVDRNEYLGTIDYELEAEYQKGHEFSVMSCVKDLLEFLDILEKSENFDEVDRRTTGVKSKSERFFERKSKL